MIGLAVALEQKFAFGSDISNLRRRLPLFIHRITMNPTIQNLPSRTVVGIGAKFISVLSPEANNFIVIPGLWQQYGPRQHEIGSRKNEAAIGAVYCLDQIENEPANQCFYFACAEVTDATTVPEGMEAREIPAGKYAVFTHKGKIENIGHTMGYIYGSWLPRSEHELRDAPELEIYGEKFDADSDDSEMEVCIPIK